MTVDAQIIDKLQSASASKSIQTFKQKIILGSLLFCVGVISFSLVFPLMGLHQDVDLAKTALTMAFSSGSAIIGSYILGNAYVAGKGL
jgi:hypothetical protein